MKLIKDKKRLTDRIVFVSGFVIILIIAMNLNFPKGKIRMGGEIWSDKAHYYAYLPALFIYNFETARYPEGIENETGTYQVLNMQKNKIFLKTTCGISILVAPFFLAAHLAAYLFNMKMDGFSMIYQQMAVVAGVFYLFLGLFFLKKFLDNYFRSWISYITLLFLLAGTNLYFYGLDDVLMSHVYSFFLISLFLYLLKIFYNDQRRKFIHFILLSVVISMLILIRPINIIAVLIAFLIDVHSFKDLRKRITLLITPRYLITVFVIGFIILIPQMIYWKYAFDSFVYYSYVGEGFTNLFSPMIIEMWFSPINGLFLYNPILVFMIAGMILMIIKKMPNGLFIFGFFLFISYIFSSWSTWYYGGSHGSRPFVDFYPLLCLPFGYLVNTVFYSRRIILIGIVTALMVFFSFYNIKLIYNYQVFTGSTWGWHDFLGTLDRSGLYNLERSSYTYMNDFENIILPDGLPRTQTKSHSGSESTYMIENIIYNCNYTRRVDNIIRHKIIKTVDYSLWINPKFFDKTGALLVFSITDQDNKPLFSEIIRADDQASGCNRWSEIKGSLKWQDHLDPTDQFTFYIWNKERKRFYIDDLELKFK